MPTIIVSTGDRIANNLNLPIFVKGAHNLGPVYENRELKSGSTPTPGMGIEHDTGAGGEDEYITGVDKSPDWYAIAEFDPGQLGLNGNGDAYTALDLIDGIPFHLNPGAYCRNIQMVDPGGTADADLALTSASGTAGKFQIVTEATLETGSTAGGFVFGTLALGENSSTGNFILSRVYMRRAYYTVDPSAAMVDVAYITGCGG